MIMKRKLKRLWMLSYFAAGGLLSANLVFVSALKNYRTAVLSVAAAPVAFFLIYQYFLYIEHCRKEYLGRHRKRWLIFLVLEPAGIVRILYTKDHIVRYMKGTGRYAYSKMPVKKRLGDLSVVVIRPDPATEKKVRSQVMPITDSPAYRYLVNDDKGDFLKYHHEIVRKKRPGYKYPVSRFKELVHDIKTSGYRNEEPYIKVKGNTISDGQHRACILYFLYGPDFEVDVVLNKNFM